MIQRSRRGQGETAKEHQANLQKTKDEVQQFLDANNLGRPQPPAEWRQCYRELGKFLAMRAFLTNTPQVVMEIPVEDHPDFVDVGTSVTWTTTFGYILTH